MQNNSTAEIAKKLVRELEFCMMWSEDDLRGISLHISFHEALAHAYEMAKEVSNAHN